MKTALILGICFGAAICLGDPQQRAGRADRKAGPETQPGMVKKLGSVTWNPEAHKLSWVIQKGTLQNGEFVSDSEERFEISPDEATMGNTSERRSFDDKEAVSLHRLLDVLSLYCAESVVWWDEGMGTPVDPDARPANPRRHPNKTKPAAPSGQKGVRVGASPPAQPPRSIEGELIAQVARVW
jgi:hypothetical protein